MIAMSGNVLKIYPIAEPTSLSQRIYDQLKSAIQAMNIYDPDADLRLDERSLSQVLGASRTPLREALTRLDQEGLVKIQPRRGIFIVRKTKAEILEMITVWAALESMAARLACTVATRDEIAQLARLAESYDAERVRAHMTEYSDDNIRFHGTIIRLSRCKLIGEMTDGLFMHVRAIRHRTIFERDRAKRSVTDHARIVAALEARDGDGVAELVRRHTMRLHDHVKAHVELE